jgi:hypothetical protein
MKGKAGLADGFQVGHETIMTRPYGASSLTFLKLTFREAS